jgi:hypothetical protein
MRRESSTAPITRTATTISPEMGTPPSLLARIDPLTRNPYGA